MKKQTQKSHKFHVRTGDLVEIIAGNDKGFQGEIVKIDTENKRAFVRGAAIVLKAVKPTADKPEGGFEEKEASIQISNLMLVNPQTGKAARVGKRLNTETGKLERYFKINSQRLKSEEDTVE